MTLVSKLLSVVIFLVTIIPVVVFGRFENEFLRLNIIFSSLIFTYFGNEHYLIRLLVTKFITSPIHYRPCPYTASYSSPLTTCT